MKRRVRFSWRKFLVFLGFNLVFAALLAPFIIFYGPFQVLKVMSVGSINTSRHPQVVRALLSSAQIDDIMHQYDSLGVDTQPNVVSEQVATAPGSGIEIQNIQGHFFKGKVMLLHDPKRVRVAVTNQLGVAGELLTDIVRQSGAVAGINAGGFDDPNGKGNGAFPQGLTVHEGKLVFIGIDDKGKLPIGPMSSDELAASHIQE